VNPNETRAHERVLKQSAAVHFGLPGVTLGLLILAVGASLAIYLGDGSDTMFKWCFCAWVATIVVGLSCFALLEWVVVDSESITHRKLLEKETFYFQDATELRLNPTGQWVAISDRNSSISSRWCAFSGGKQHDSRTKTLNALNAAADGRATMPSSSSITAKN